MADLLKGLNISVFDCRKSSMHSSVILEYSSIFHKPSDLIQYNIERAKQKFNKSVEIINRIEALKTEEKKKAENMIRKSKEREKKMMEEMNKRQEEHEKATLSLQEQRRKILLKKREIEHDLDKQFFEYGVKLEGRMHKLSLMNQRKLREMVEKQRETVKKRIQDDYGKITNAEYQLRIQEGEIREIISSLHSRIEKRIITYEDNVKNRVSNARENNIRVDRIFSKSLTDYNKKTEERLKRAIEKSIVSEEKKGKKQEKFRKYSDDMRNSVRSSSMRTNKLIDNIHEIENRRIQKIEQRSSSKTKIYNDIKSQLAKESREKIQKSINRFEDHSVKYSKALESQVSHI